MCLRSPARRLQAASRPLSRSGARIGPGPGARRFLRPTWPLATRLSRVNRTQRNGTAVGPGLGQLPTLSAACSPVVGLRAGPCRPLALRALSGFGLRSGLGRLLVAACPPRCSGVNGIGQSESGGRPSQGVASPDSGRALAVSRLAPRSLRGRVQIERVLGRETSV